MKIIIIITIITSSLFSRDIQYYSSQGESFAEVSIGDLTFNCRVSGLDNNGPTVILLHGFPETSRMWKDLISLLSEEGYRIIAPDQRGYSPKARPVKVDEYKIEKLSSDITAIADAFKVNEFHLVGHDWGAGVGWYLCSVEGSRILSFSALSVPHMDPFVSAIKNDPIQKKKSTYISYFTKPFLPEIYFKLFNYRNLKSIWTHSSKDEIDSYIDIFSQKKALKASLNWYRANLNGDTKSIGNIQVPTLMLWGKNDIAVGETSVIETEKYIDAPYKLEKIDAGHWLIQESFLEVSQHILEHIKKYNEK